MDLSEFDIDFLSQKLSDNPQSPLFARLADIYLSKNQASEALKLCEAGVQVYSSYSTGYVVLGKCYLALNENSKARLAFSQALHLAPFNQVARTMLDEIPFAAEEPLAAPSAEEPPVTASQEPAAETAGITPEYSTPPEPQETSADSIGVTPEFSALPETPEPAAETVEAAPGFPAVPEDAAQTIELPEPQQHVEEIPPAHVYENPLPQAVSSAGEPEVLPGVEEYVQQKSDAMAAEKLISLDEYLAGVVPVLPSAPPPVPAAAPAAVPPPAPEIDSIAAQLETAERIMPPKPEPAPPQPESAPLDSTVITPTLAEIYASQGEYGAAIQAYEILLFSKPGERERFEKRIKELQAKLFEGT